MEGAVCRHGILFKALNMFRGEIFAYPLFLQKELAMAYKIQFICTDIMCKYYPYLQKVCKSFRELVPLLQNRPFLFVMSAKGHSGKCEVNIYSRLPPTLYIACVMNVVGENKSKYRNM